MSDFVQCDEEMAVSLRDTLWSLLFNSSLGQVVKTQLSLALAALAAQSNEALWSDPVGMTFENISLDKPAVIEFIAHLPEQLMNKLIPLPRSFFYAQRHRLVDGKFEQVLSMLINQLDDPKCRKAVLSALYSWIRYSEVDNEGNSNCTSAVTSPALLEATFKFVHMGFESPDVLDDAVELVCEVMFKVHQLDDIESPEWLAILFAGLESVHPTFIKAISQPDDDAEEVVRKLTILFTEAGQAFMMHLMNNHKILEIVVGDLLTVADISNRDTVEASFPFWELLSSRVSDMSEDARQPYIPVFQRLFRSCIEHQLVLPSTELTMEEMDNFREFRHTVGDCLKDCVRAMGSTEALLVCYQYYQDKYSGGDWRLLDAFLFALRTIASSVDRRESEALPQLFPLILSIKSYPKLVYGVLLIIGSYADWLKYNQAYIPSVLEYISSAMSTGDSKCSSALAQALKYLGQSCARALLPHLATLESLYQSAAIARTAPHMRDRLDLSEALGNILAVVDEGTFPGHIRLCIDPWVAKLNVLQEAEEALEHYQRLAVPAESVSSPAILAHFNNVAWPAILQLPHPQHPESFYETLASALVSILSSFLDYLPAEWDQSFFAFVQSILEMKHIVILSLIKMFILTTNSTRQALAWPHIHRLLESATSTISTTPDLNNLADYFSACTAIIDYYGIVGNPELVDRILSVTKHVLGTTPPVPGDIFSALNLLQHLLQAFLSENIHPSPNVTLLTGCTQAFLVSCLVSYPPDVLFDIPPVLLRIYKLIPSLPSSLMQELLASLPADSFVEREKIVLLEQFQTALESPRANRDLREFLRNLSQSCKRKMN